MRSVAHFGMFMECNEFPSDNTKLSVAYHRCKAAYEYDNEFYLKLNLWPLITDEDAKLFLDAMIIMETAPFQNKRN